MQPKTPSKRALAPFSCQYSPQTPELLSRLGCSLAISTYQAGKLIFISAKDENSLIQLPRHFEKVMGIAYDEATEKMALACKEEVICFKNSKQLAAYYPKATNVYDAMFMPRLTYHTGALDIHDLKYGKNQNLLAVNTLFSCLIELGDDFNFTPIWKPKFIDKLTSEDRCHLNGMALESGEPRYVTAFNTGNSYQSWRKDLLNSGVVIDVKTNEVLTSELGMPHSPCIFNGELYVLLSATGELIKVDRATGETEQIVKVDAFLRGMSLYQDYLFIGMSKLRKNSSTFAKLERGAKADRAGILIVHLPTGSIAGSIDYLTSLDEIYDIEVLPDSQRPNILNAQNPYHKMGLSIPNETFWAQDTSKQNQ